MPSGVRDGRLGRACRELDGRGGGVEQRLEQLAVALDADELEVQGLIRSVSLRTNLDRELRIGETFSMRGRCWVVSEVVPYEAKVSTDG